MWKSKDNDPSNKKVTKKFYELFAQPSYILFCFLFRYNSPLPLLCRIQIYSYLKTLLVQISWFLMKPSDRDQHCLPLWLQIILMTGMLQVKRINLGRGVVHTIIQHDRDLISNNELVCDYRQMYTFGDTW